MINYIERNGFIKLYINSIERDYSIDLIDLGRTTNWNIFLGAAPPLNRIIQNVSHWVMHISLKKDVDEGFLNSLSELIKEKAPDNKIDWPATFKALSISNEYKSLIHPNVEDTDKPYIKKITVMGSIIRIKEYSEVAEHLIEKYKL